MSQPELPLGVFGDEVVFQIHGIALLQVAKVCFLKGVGNDPEAEASLGEGGYSQ